MNTPDLIPNILFLSYVEHFNFIPVQTNTG